MGGRLASVAEKHGFRVVVPVGGSVYVGEREARRAVLRVLWLYGYLAGSSLGSRGAFKLAHGRYGDVVPTGRLYPVLAEVEKSNPLVEMLWEAARGVWRVYGDGVKTVLLLAYKLYERAYRLMRDTGLRPSTVLDGYSEAHRVHLRVLRGLAGRVRPLTCLEAARSILTGSHARDVLAPLLCRAVERWRRAPCRLPLSEAVAFERVEGGSAWDTTLLEGVLVRKRPSRLGMPRVLGGPLRVAVVDEKLYVDLRYEGYLARVEDPELAYRLGEAAAAAVSWVPGRLASLGVGVLVNVKGVDSRVEEELERMGVVVLRRVPPERARLIAAATGARLASSLRDLQPSWLGVADGVEELVYRDRYYTLIRAQRGCASTIVLRGPWHVVDTAYEEARMALRGLERWMEDPRGLPGGGAPEAEAALRVREAARHAGGKRQLAMEAYAEALEAVPSTLARHSALDPHEAIADLAALHASGHWAAGVDEDRMEVAEDVAARGILDPYPHRLQAITTAYELAATLLRVTGIAVHKRGQALRETREAPPPGQP